MLHTNTLELFLINATYKYNVAVSNQCYIQLQCNPQWTPPSSLKDPCPPNVTFSCTQPLTQDHSPFKTPFVGCLGVTPFKTPFVGCLGAIPFKTPFVGCLGAIPFKTPFVGCLGVTPFKTPFVGCLGVTPFKTPFVGCLGSSFLRALLLDVWSALSWDHFTGYLQRSYLLDIWGGQPSLEAILLDTCGGHPSFHLFTPLLLSLFIICCCKLCIEYVFVCECLCVPAGA